MITVLGMIVFFLNRAVVLSGIFHCPAFAIAAATWDGRCRAVGAVVGG
jgi:hypothetical protein